MKEKAPKITNLHEQSLDVEQFGEIAHERHEVMKNTLERAERRQKSHHSEREVLAEAQRLAGEVESDNKNNSSVKQPEKHRSPISKKQLDASFKAQIEAIAGDLTTVERATSRFIHYRLIEKTSDVVATTFARPNAMLSGSIAAFIGITLAYFISKYYGFQLSGFETIGAFIIGWIVGVLYDYISIKFRKSR